MKSDEYQLKVAEAQYRDVGKGIARIAKRIMSQLSLQSGDVIEVEGKNSLKTSAIVWPTYTSVESLDNILIDRITRQNAGVHLDDNVTIRKAVTLTATAVTLLSTSTNTIGNAKAFFNQKLQGRALSIGDQMRFGSMDNIFEYKVVEVQPDSESVVVNKETEIIIDSKESTSLKEQTESEAIPRVSYEDIGGLDETIKNLREMVELPMRYPELFQRLGVNPPKGVLLHGPPGTGKTLLAKAVASESASHFMHVSGPEIMSKFYGESEQKIREIFDEAAKNEPSIIFIDEIDSIAPKRDDQGSGEVERRVVSQMLSLMDGLSGRGETIVIGATNRPNSIDPALRRPGRFDREIEIPVPTSEARKVILEIQTRYMPLAEDVDMSKIVEHTKGFVGADLSSLTKEAGMKAIRRLFPKIVWGESISVELLNQISVTAEDFENALRGIKPSALREVLIDIPTVAWDDIGGLDEVKQQLREAIEWPTIFPSLYRYMGSEPPRGILLTGSPGTGKTLLVKAVANQSSRNFISIKGAEIHSKWIGESERTIQEIFRKARLTTPCIVFFDEIDTIFPVRNESNPSSERLVTTLLTEMDGLEEIVDIIVIGATNRPDMIDPAVLRPGRFDHIITLPLPDSVARGKILQIHIKNKPLDSKISIDSLAEITDGFSGADLKGVVNLASSYATSRFLSQIKEKNQIPTDIEIQNLTETKKPKIRMDDFEKAVSTIRTSSKHR
ncbi:AAA family ATPase [Candidatus Heimdallarchaeota archaeon B3_Heim]|nr:MAG: AAA family ATPase [Candidatus Heimdallarchaeota archaeon B3_Heim]